jgi:hypothetical protein
MLHVYGDFKPRESIHSVLTTRVNYDQVSFSASTWVADEPSALEPQPVIKRYGADPIAPDLVHKQLDLIENNAVRQVWHLRARLGDTMLVFDAYVYIYSGQDAVRLEGTFTNSDPTKKELNEEFEYLGVQTGEYFVLDYREHYNLPPLMGAKPWLQAVADRRVLADAQQIRFSGWMLCLPKRQPIDVLNPSDLLRLDSLRAYIQRGAVYGIGDFHSTPRWLAFKVAPKIPTRDIDILHRFEEHIRLNKVDLYDQKYKNLAKRPANTGAQEDFGACKGGACVRRMEPLLIQELDYMVSEHFRPFHNRQTTGDPITKESNPQLWTWSQLPIGTTQPPPPDDLGKGFDEAQGIWPPRREGTGYEGEDDQHRSQNTFNAAYALTGSYALRDILFDFYEIDRCQVPNRIGAPRAIGRLFMAWSSILLLLPPEKAKVLEDHMRTRMDVILAQWLGFHVPEDRPIRVLGTARSPSTLTDADGQPVEAWVVWEHSIAAMGFYAAMINSEGPDHDRYKWAATHFAQLVALFGTFFDGVGWRCCTAVAYPRGDQEGNPVEYSLNNKHQLRVVGEDAQGWWAWILPAIKICRALTAEISVKKRCDEIIQQVETPLMTSWQHSEWLAVV